MDGKHRNPSLMLVFASVPVQALLMAGVAAAVLNGASSASMQDNMAPYPGPPGLVFVKPVPDCGTGWGSLKGPQAQAGDGQYDPAMPVTPVTPDCATYINPQLPDGAQYSAVCCGWGSDGSAP